MSFNIDGDALLIEFTSDSSVTDEGFSFTYAVHDIPVEHSSGEGSSQGLVEGSDQDSSEGSSQGVAEGSDQGSGGGSNQVSGSGSGSGSNHSSSLPAACMGDNNVDIVRGTGSIQSPADGTNNGNYFNNLRCAWLVYGEGNQVRIKFVFVYSSKFNIIIYYVINLIYNTN